MNNLSMTLTSKFAIFNELVQNDTNLSISSIILRLCVSLLAAVFIYFIYKFTFNGVTFNRNFGGAIVITTLITSTIMMIINSNLALSLGMVGALSIIRFRNAVKDSRDISFIFWSVAAGLAAGTGLYPIVFIATIFIGVCVVIFNLTGFTRKSYLLIIKTDTEQADAELLKKAVDYYSVKYRLRMKNTHNGQVESIYEINLKKGASDVIVDKIAGVKGVLSVNLVSSNESI